MKLTRILLFFLALVVSVLSQGGTPNSDWNGDERVCTPENSTSPSGGTPVYPDFPLKAEFTLEVVQMAHLADIASPSIITKYQYLYDYTANYLVLIKNDGGLPDIEYYYYEKGLKSTYYRGEYCVVTSIPINVENDGNSAILINGVKHIRPMKEFLLFARDREGTEPIRPKFHGQTTIRGITANKWETCIVDKVNRITEKRVWYFAAPGQKVPSANPVANQAVPLQAEISRSFDDENGTQIFEFDTIFSVHTFRPGLIESSEQLAPPKGVFCSSGRGQNLYSLADIGINWPDRFSVRVDVSSSRSTQMQRFHLRYDRRDGSDGRILRYDYLPVGSSDYRSVIHDYSQRLTYFIDLQTGGCRIRQSIDFFDVSPIRDPIDFFIKNEDIFVLNRTAKIWESNGLRSCRGSSIECSVVTAQILNFPVIVESDTGRPTGESWKSMSMEYAWSLRAPLVPDADPDRPRGFDYPAHLFLRFYRDNASAIPMGGGNRNEDVEYEFFEMSGDVNSRDFDVSTCYRANNYDYIHLTFVFTFNSAALTDDNSIDRRELQRAVTRMLRDTMKIGISRISGVEIDHETVSNNVTVFFTLLGKLPNVPTVEPSLKEAQENLQKSIDDGNFKVEVLLTDVSSTRLTFTAAKNSLNASKQYFSIHATGEKVVEESYSGSAEAVAVIVGLLVGLLIGVIIAVAFRIIRKEPVALLPNGKASISNPLPSIRFQNKKASTENQNTPPSDA